MNRGMRPRPTMARLMSKKSKVLSPGSSEDSKQKKVIEEFSRPRKRQWRLWIIMLCGVPPLQGTLSVNPSGEVMLDSPPQVTQNPGGLAGGPYDSRKKLRELIGNPGPRMPDDALRNVPFYPSMGAHAVKKYFTLKWKEFASHGDLGDVLEAVLATTIWASAMQLTKKLDYANAVQKITAEALETANQEKKLALKKIVSYRLEAERLRGSLEASEKGRKDAEAEEARLLAKEKEMEEKIGSVKAKYVANFHNTNVYTNLSDYFAKVGYQEVLAMLRSDYPNFNVGYLEARFPPPDVKGDEDS
ncbi:hypothetical protein Adt_31053 [Abeliophyllum distichum]|uniref:Uncharacterized protein n=1 Tax=Abeliophyllum distichum TaxID=126358 RepID=A0ABD1RD04_9LAMI